MRVVSKLWQSRGWTVLGLSDWLTMVVDPASYPNFDFLADDLLEELCG
jgi:hypothetical protein